MDHIQCSEDARQAARRRLPRMLFDFIDGGAGEERAARRNREALARIELLPRVLENVEVRRIAVELLGCRWKLPFGIASMGMCDLAWPGTDRAFGEEARDFSIPHCLSTAASTSLEDCRARTGDNRGRGRTGPDRAHGYRGDRRASAGPRERRSAIRLRPGMLWQR